MPGSPSRSMLIEEEFSCGINSILSVQSYFQKYSASPSTQIKSTTSLSRSHKRGVSRSSRTLGTGCDGRGSVRRAKCVRTNDVAVDGEVVWSWRPDAGAKVRGCKFAERRWQKSPVTGESTKDTVKTIVQGMPADAVCPWLLTRVLFYAHAASGATRIRHSLRPLCFSRVVCLNNSDAFVPRECRRVSQHTPSLRGAQRRSNPDCLRGGILDCFAEPVIGRAFARPVGSQ